jgi:uncharacterized membrane protein YphA (DoxX/SURF4 family)
MADMTYNRASKLRSIRIDTGLLILRVAAGLSLFILFGLTKLKDAAAFADAGHSWSFVDFNRRVGLPVPVIVACYQTLNESLGALLVASGFLTGFAAASVGLGFAAATYFSTKSGEGGASMIAAFYCLIFSTLALTGAGRFSMDEMLRLRRVRKMSLSSRVK